jgi:hypothetical protein
LAVAAAAITGVNPSVAEPSDRFNLDVETALKVAYERKLRVTVIVRGDLANGREARMIEGVPVAFRRPADGRLRVLIETGPDDSSQLLLVDRIARVAMPGRTTP